MLVNCSLDRHAAHKNVAEYIASNRELLPEDSKAEVMLSPDGTPQRQYLWRQMNEMAWVRDHLDIRNNIIPQNEGDLTAFSIDLIPVKKINGKRKFIKMDEETVQEWFVNKLGDSMKIEKIQIQIEHTIINKKNNTYTRPYAYIFGLGMILNKETLQRLYINGIGDSKAYGFGMLSLSN